MTSWPEDQNQKTVGTVMSNDATRFWARVEIVGSLECWPWIGYRDRKGYGKLYLHGVPWLAHRLAWEFTYGPLSLDVCVLHYCDNPPCVNPRHLWLGTVVDNNKDCIRKGRRLSSYTAKLTNADVTKIRELRGMGELVSTTYRVGIRGMTTIPALAKRFGVSKTTIANILYGVSWNHA